MSVAVPTTEHVNVGVADAGWSNEPLEAVQAYARAFGTGPLTIEETETEEPTVVSSGTTARLFTVAQLKLPASAIPDGANSHPIAMPTCVVWRAATPNCAEPMQVMLPSTVVAESEIE